jgi:hypothetical protein
MMNILIPTDFTLASADVRARVARSTNERLTIYLFHAFDMPASLMEVMTRGGSRGRLNLMTDELRHKCKKIKLQHPNICHISYRPLYGSTDAVFRNYAEANEIHMIALPPDMRFVPAVRESIDPMRMFRRSGIMLLTDLAPLSAIPDARKRAADARLRSEIEN